MAEDVKQQHYNAYKYSGQAFINMINKYFMFNDNKERNITFLEIDNSVLFLCIDSINGRRTYNFTEKYHNKVTPKFEMDSNYIYYLYNDMIEEFNNLDEQRQLDLLKTITINDLCVGIINKNELQQFLRPLIKTGTNYRGYVAESSEVSGYYWWHLKKVTDELSIAIYVNSLVVHISKMKVEVQYDKDKKKQKYPDKLVNQTVDLINNDIDSTGLFRVRFINSDARQTQYLYRFDIFAKDIQADNGKALYLFSILFYPNGLYTQASINMNKSLNEERLDNAINTNRIKMLCNTMTTLKDKLHTIGDAFEEDKELLKIGKVLSDL